MDRLPFEIWGCVSEFLNDKELKALIGVNRFFFDLGMDQRYNEITIDIGDKRATRWLTQILEPQVAQRVRKLTVHLLHPVSPPTRAVAEQKRVGKQMLGHLRHAIDKVVPGPSRSTPTPTPTPAAGVEGMIKILCEAFPGMKKVEDFRIVTWALQASCNLDVFYTAAWSAFGDNLRRVSICANLEGHRALIDSNPKFANLETLEMEFSDNIQVTMNPFSNSTLGEEAILTQSVVPFVNVLCPQIKTLKMRSWAKVDLSHFFLHLDPLPKLQSTLIRVPFNHALRIDPSGFTRFLLTSSTSLNKVALRLTPTSLALDPNREEFLCTWMKDTVSDPRCFANAKELDICPTHLPGGMDILHQCVQRSASQLTSFTVRDRYLQTDDIISLVQALAKCTSLTSLRLNVFALSAVMFDALASNLPALRYLWLSVGDADPATSNTLEVFRKDMEGRRYENWKLWDLTIWQSGLEPDRETMFALSRSIPSVQSFWGTGRTDACN